MNSILKNFIAGVLALVSAATFAAVDVNKATQADLETVSGVGPAMSTRILDERKKSAFQDWSDLIVRVKGVGVGNAAKFSNGGLTVNGAAYKAVPAAAHPAAPAKPTKAQAGEAKKAKGDAAAK
ncbi:hypothetical protein BH11PSE9_BH11PSE9_07800 [soil metagenome]